MERKKTMNTRKEPNDKGTTSLSASCTNNEDIGSYEWWHSTRLKTAAVEAAICSMTDQKPL